MKFILLVEGDTEKQAVGAFLKRWLDSQLTEAVGIRVVNFHGNSRLARDVVVKARAYLDGPDAGEIVAVIALLDMYGLDCYPPTCTAVNARYDWGVAEFESKVDHPKFRMFFAVHESEAWILAQPECLPRKVRELLPPEVSDPERVNFNRPPATLLNRLYRQSSGKEYKKTTYGKQLFSRLDPKAVAEKCPYLRAMLREMLELARAAGL